MTIETHKTSYSFQFGKGFGLGSGITLAVWNILYQDNSIDGDYMKFVYLFKNKM